MKEMGIGEFCQHTEHHDIDLLIEQFTSLASNRAKYEQTMREVNGVYSRRLAFQEQLLIDQVL